jgi:uncharacterized protein (UPF0303 family)
MDTKTKRLINFIKSNKEMLKRYKEDLEKQPNSTFYKGLVMQQQDYIETLEKELNKNE